MNEKGQTVSVGSVATGSLPVLSAEVEADRMEWEAAEWKKLATYRRNEKEIEAAAACEAEANRILAQAGLIRHAARATERQPEENT